MQVDGDANEDILEDFEVSAFPTFHFFSNGVKVDELVGGNPIALEEKLKALK